MRHEHSERPFVTGFPQVLDGPNRILQRIREVVWLRRCRSSPYGTLGLQRVLRAARATSMWSHGRRFDDAAVWPSSAAVVTRQRASHRRSTALVPEAKWLRRATPEVALVDDAAGGVEAQQRHARQLLAAAGL